MFGASATRSQSGVLSILGLHLLVWTLVPTLVNPNLPLDVIEGLAWGNAWQWGYDKHPPLSAWLVELAYSAAPGQGWPVYLLSAISVTLAFWAVWRLALDFVTPRRALIVVALLEGIYYHNFTSPEFNANVVLLPFWALAVLCLWRGISRGGLGTWALFGLFGALALLGKYFSVFLIVPLGLYLVLDRTARRCWRTPGPYLAMGVGLVVLAPHLWWVWANDFQTITYALNRSGSASASFFARHVGYPAKFLAAQLLAFSLMLALFRALGQPGKPALNVVRERGFLLVAGIAPLVLVLLTSVLFGLRLRSMWGTPLFLYSSLIVVLWLPVARLNLRRFRALWWGFFLLAPALYAAISPAQPYVTGKGGRVLFPGKSLARQVAAAWEVRFGGALPIVIGTDWLAGNVGAYAPARPAVYINGDVARSPWVDDVQVRERGAAIVWKLAQGAAQGGVPGGYAERFPCLEVLPPLELSWQSGAELPPLPVGLALVAPASNCYD